jgi:2-amino-4-hydroxy-6-hydroxymethyldihydropteridine diphosphokinase
MVARVILALAKSCETPVTAFIGIGSNLSGTFINSQALLNATIDAISALPFTYLIARSSYYRSAPLDAGGADYTNAVLSIQTSLQALDLLDQLQAIEQQFARERPYKNAPRTLDLDLLTWGNLKLNSARLTLPHPRLTERAFVVLPLHELAPQFAIEGLGNVQEWRTKTSSQRIQKIEQQSAR